MNMISVKNNPIFKRNKELEKRLSEVFSKKQPESECSLNGHPNAEYQGMSSASGAMYLCPDCNHYIFKKSLTPEQQKNWHNMMNRVLD